MDQTAQGCTATTHPGRVAVTLGGVARNVAETASKVLSADTFAVKLISPYGMDEMGLLLRRKMQDLGMRTDGLFHPATGSEDARTAVCSLLLDARGDLISGVADMDISQTQMLSSCSTLPDLLEQDMPRIVAFDGNIGESHASQLLTACQSHGQCHPSQPIVTVFEPTSVSKSTIVLEHFLKSDKNKMLPVTYATPNTYELQHMYDHAKGLGLLRADDEQVVPSPGHIAAAILPGQTLQKALALVYAGIFEVILLKVGKHGVVTISKDLVSHEPIPSRAVTLVNTTGCGDSFVGGFIAALCRLKDDQNFDTRHTLHKATLAGQLAARNTIQSTLAVGPNMEDILSLIGLPSAVTLGT